MDLKNILKDETDDSEKKSTPKKHKKPVQLREIESSNFAKFSTKMESKEEMKSLLNKEKKDILKQPWNKLDTGMKLGRIKLFVEKEAQEKQLDESKKEGLKKLLYSACKSNKLSKNTEIVYNRENSMIETIKVLKYENGKYTLKTTETKKSKSSTKSKSNIERLIRNA
tara:strand:- start:146 stop:649 length:504 start_codon:yes stop_codon:yes gene_type:complete